MNELIRKPDKLHVNEDRKELGWRPSCGFYHSKKSSTMLTIHFYRFDDNIDLNI